MTARDRDSRSRSSALLVATVLLAMAASVAGPSSQFANLPPRLSALHLLRDFSHNQRLRLGDPSLDAALEGGLDVAGSITEIAGEAGTGKSQLALQLMLQVQLPPHLGGLGGGAIYLNTELNSDPTMKRLHTMGAAFAERHRAIGADVETLKHHVYVLSIETSEDLWDTVDSRLPAFIAQQMKDPTGMEVRLLVIDSLGALLRAWETHPQADAATSAKERARYVQKLAARLKQISAAFKVAVVVLNQVADKPFDEAQRRAAAPWERGPCATPDGMGARVPALGAAWASCVNTRLVLTREATAGEAEGVQHPPSAWRRELHVAWSPRLGERSVPFELAEHGLAGVTLALR